MLYHKKIVFLALYVFLVCFVSPLISQEPDRDSIHIPQGYILVLKDTIIVPGEDTIILLPSSYEYKIKYDPYFKSQNFYDSLRVRSGKKRWLAEFYNLLVVNQANKGNDTLDNVSAEKEYLPYEGLIINAIHITSVDVLAGSVNDTSISSTKDVSNFLNSTHIDTRKKIIKKNLIIHKGESINAFRLADSERILRSLNFIEEARIVVLPIDENRADVIVITKDMFPIGMGFSYSSINNFEIELSHRNIFGIGHEIKYRALYNSHFKPIIGNQLEYGINNISNSFIRMYLRYLKTPERTIYNARLNKEFLTFETKYAGGIKIQYLYDSLALSYQDTTIRYSFKRNDSQTWLGRSFQLSEKNRTNLIISTKYNKRLYQNRPATSTDTNQYFQNTSLILGKITLIKNKNIKTKYLREFGITEDIPVGYSLSLTSGYYWSDIHNFYYGSIRFGFGHAFAKGGYLGLSTEYGSFFNKEETLQGSFIWRMFFYTPLVKLNRSRLRFGGSFIYELGLNRYDYEWISLEQEVKGLSAYDTRGTSKTVLTLEAIYFSNVFFYGFRFAPYVFTDIGLIRNHSPVIYLGKLHVGIGFGLRIRNESLVFPTLDLNFVFYTSNPTSDRKYRFNADATERRIFDDLKVGEPYIIPFGVSNY